MSMYDVYQTALKLLAINQIKIPFKCGVVNL